MSSSTEEMTASITQVADYSHSVSEHASNAGKVAQESGREVHAVTEEIALVADAVSQASQVISALGEESKRITAIVDTIRDIADQTNLLALNAAIEAARAGEQGRGFAVVADEVRKLAERTTHSTQEISGMVEAINHSAAEAVQRMDQSLVLVGQGVSQAEHAYQAMSQVGTNTEKVVVEINEINSSLQEQRAASVQIAQHVEQIAQMAERNVTSIAGIASHVSDLEQLARNLESQMQHFRV
jgi:methyl-accepting chemotaxis protein